MRSWKWIVCVLVLGTACGEASVAPTTSDEPPGVTTTSTTSPATSTARPTTTAPTIPATAPPPTGQWSVESLGRNPDVIGPAGAMGSGCSPGAEALPDGVWLAWIEEVGPSSVQFDLACLWPGRLEPAASNDSTRIRSIDVAKHALVYLDDDPIAYADWSGATKPAANAPGLSGELPCWIFTNDGEITEIAEYPEPIDWARSANSWPELVPGCCDGGVEAPPSPPDPWPASGWPADGFYSANLVDPSAWPETGSPPALEIEIGRYLSCREHPEFCQDWWTGDEVSGDPDETPLVRSLALDTNLTVVVKPIFSETTIVGDGKAYAALLRDLSESRAPLGDPAGDWDAFAAAVREAIADPASSFGIPASPDSSEDWPIGYKGPGNAYLTFERPPWMVLEIRNGLPILYVHAGTVTG